MNLTAAIYRRAFLLVLAGLFLPVTVRAAEVMPPAPDQWFNDYAGFVSPEVAVELNLQLKQFEADTSNQILVVIYDKMQSESDISDYTYRVKERWRVGQKGKNNGAVLFVFKEGHKIYIQTGYGLEGALPDALCKQIIEDKMAPLFRQNDDAGGLRAGINAMLAATKGEFKGTGKNTNSSIVSFLAKYIVWIISGFGGFLAFGVFLFIVHNFGGTFYQRHRRSLTFAENVYMFFLNIGFSFFSGGGSSSSDGESSGSSGFSGGGGTGGGGGAGGTW